MENEGSPPAKRKASLWTWEWVALVTSLCSIVGSVVLLRIFDNQPIPEWSWRSTGISINTILSLLSALSRTYLLIPLDACMGQLMWIKFAGNKSRKLANIHVFDQATRGAWGALRLIVRQKGMSWPSLGAFLLVASYGLGVAQQQLISYPSRQVILRNATASVTRAHFYNQSENVTQNGVTTVEMTYRILSSIYNSILGSEATAENYNSSGWNAVNMPFYDCDTGNCQFPSFTSLAICSECHDVSASITNYCSPENDVCVASYGDTTATTFSTAYGENSNTLFNQTIINTNESRTLQHIPPGIVLAGFSSIKSTNTFPATHSATECALFWCLKTYNSSVSTGIYSERVISSNTAASYGQGDSAISFFDSNSTEAFTVSANAHSAITNPTTGLPSKLQGWTRAIPNSELFSYSSDIMRGLDAKDNLTAAITVMSIGLSNHVRNAALSSGPISASSQGVTTGNVIARQTFIRVRWFWLAYPVGMWFLSAVFFLTTVIKASFVRNKIRPEVWGISPLAYMIHGLDEDTRKMLGDMRWEDAETIADDLHVRLVSTNYGLKLRASNTSEKGWRPPEIVYE